MYTLYKSHNISGGYVYHLIIFPSASREPSHKNECVPLPLEGWKTTL